jgi:CHAT domain-containing protein/Tfp pilus assembly protein PilF
MKGRLLWGLVWALVSISAPALAGPPTEHGGLLVLTVGPHFGGNLAGLQPGDWIDTWSRVATPPADPQGATGTFTTPFDLWHVIFEQAPRGRVTVYGRRDGEEKTWIVPPSRSWGLDTRPALTAELLDLYDQDRAAVQAGDLDRALALSERVIAALAQRGDVLKAAWLEWWVATAAAQAQRWEQSDAAIERAVDRLTVNGHVWEAVSLLRASGLYRQNSLDWEAARRRYRRALALARNGLGPNLFEAKVWLGLGFAASKAGDLAESEHEFLEALHIIETLAPDSLDRAEALTDLGELDLQRGDLTAADRRGREALALQEKLAPDGLDTAATLMNLADLASLRGFLPEAETLYRRALANFEKDTPGGRSTAHGLAVLATLALQRGNLALAEEYLQRSLDLFAEDRSESYEFSDVLVTLAGVAIQRGELASAHQYLTRALEAREQLSRDSTSVADALLSLGRLAIQRGEPAEARRHLERALAIRRQQKERSVHVAAILRELGSLDAGGAAAEKREALLVEAASIFSQEAPGGLAEAEADLALGRRWAARGELEGARARFSRALEIRHRLAPGSVEEADALYRLGLVKQRMGRVREGARDLCATIDLLDRQRRMFGGPAEARAYFEATVVPYYETCLSALLARGRRSAAFAVLERGRARAFLALLAERELRPAELPPDLVAERWQLGAAYDRLQETLRQLSPERNSAEVERLQAALSELRHRQEALAERVQKASPRTAALRDPQPIDLSSTRAALEPGTVLLSYSVGERETFLFVIESARRPGTGLTVHTLPIGRQALHNRVDRLRRLLQSSAVPDELFLGQAARLYRLLLQPAEPAFRSAVRILICPDGPLHALPFAALRRGGKYLAEWKPIHFAPSATAYAELRRARTPSGRPRLPPLPMAAFGDPQYPLGAPGFKESPGDAEVRSAVRRGLTLESLPASREEAAGVAGLFPGGRAFLGAEATEEEVKRIAPRARFLHFACHAFLDEQMALNSGLALSIPEHPAEGQDNGILQAWEIFESLRLDADLVTLSACDTALGRDMGGEGILGLTRAFQFAGARSVLASLWSVADDSTADLMRRFYTYLKQGKSKDEALRLAQVDLIRGPEATSHPYHWAAFQLSGDWR